MRTKIRLLALLILVVLSGCDRSFVFRLVTDGALGINFGSSTSTVPQGIVESPPETLGIVPRFGTSIVPRFTTGIVPSL